MSFNPLIHEVSTSYVIISRQMDSTQYNPITDKMFIFIGYLIMD